MIDNKSGVIAVSFLTGFATLALAVPASAGDFQYRRDVTLSVGQSIVLKGVRSGECSTTEPPAWNNVKGKLPASTLGTFSDGGAGTVQSNSCGKRVAARGVKFKASRKGEERFVVFDDAIRVTVK